MAHGSSNNGTDFHLPDEILSVIPTDPYEQLDLARKITSMAIASRVSKLESENSRLHQKISEKDNIIFKLEEKVVKLERGLEETNSRFRRVADENAKLLNERESLAASVKKLNRDLSKDIVLTTQVEESFTEVGATLNEIKPTLNEVEESFIEIGASSNVVKPTLNEVEESFIEIGAISNEVKPTLNEVEESVPLYDQSTSFMNTNVYKDPEELITWCKNTGKTLGTVIITGRSDRNSGRTPRWTLICERGGQFIPRKPKVTNPDVTPSPRPKRIGTKKCGCPFKLRVLQNKEGSWILHVVCGSHNHPLSENLVANSYIARLAPQEELTSALSMSGAKRSREDARNDLPEEDEQERSKRLMLIS